MGTARTGAGSAMAIATGSARATGRTSAGWCEWLMGGDTPARSGGFIAEASAVLKPTRVRCGSLHQNLRGRPVMTWMRDVLFLGVIGGGALALGANLVPPREPKPITGYDAAAYREPEFRAAVERADA